jgi:hypothetical protein
MPSHDAQSPREEASPPEGTAALTPRSRLKLTLSQFWSIQVAIVGVAIVLYGAYRDLKDDMRSFRDELRRIERAVGVRGDAGRPDRSSDDSSAVPAYPASRPVIAVVPVPTRSTP